MKLLSVWSKEDFPHFIPEEFMCKCGCNQIKLSDNLLRIVSSIRNQIGVPIIITSGYRCPEHNKKVGGHPNSYHTKGLACDIKVVTYQWPKLILALFDHKIERIGFYLKRNNLKWIHIDIGKYPSPAFWFKGV